MFLLDWTQTWLIVSKGLVPFYTTVRATANDTISHGKLKKIEDLLHILASDFSFYTGKIIFDDGTEYGKVGSGF